MHQKCGLFCSIQWRHRGFPLAHAYKGAAHGRHLTHFRDYDGANGAIGHVVRQAVSGGN